jgi:hypothetical protein
VPAQFKSGPDSANSRLQPKGKSWPDKTATSLAQRQVQAGAPKANSYQFRQYGSSLPRPSASLLTTTRIPGGCGPRGSAINNFDQQPYALGLSYPPEMSDYEHLG